MTHRRTTRRGFLCTIGLATAGLAVGRLGRSGRAASAGAAKPGKPNVVFILADDWGYGDVKCFGGDRCRIPTPHMDALAARGMKFTDAHSSSSVCTPTRYSVMTGRYNWRTKKKSGVLNGYAPALIEPGRETVPSMLKKHGYTTAMVGKWHLGMGFPTTDGKEPQSQVDKKKRTATSNFDWNAKISSGPCDAGFDYYWGISASLDMAPYVWIENNRFTEPGTKPNDMCRPGPQGPSFVFSEVLPTIAKKSVAWIKEQAKNDKPFFLYMPLASPHTPIVPSKAFQGKSPHGEYGDFVMETDWSVGQIVKAVEEAGISDNTLIIVTADNGCSPAASRGFKDKGKIKFRMDKPVQENPDVHYPSDIYRGHKADIYEGGHRVPFIVRWDGKVKPGSVSDQTICLVDLFATCADIVDAEIPDTAAEDSVSILPVLAGRATGPVHEAVIHHSYNGSFAIRKGKWKLAFCPGSGGWSNPTPWKGSKERRELDKKRGRFCVEPEKFADHEWVQLYDMESDPAELKNLSGEYPKVVKQLTALAQKYIDDGRSTPGAKQQNSGDTFLYAAWIRKYRSK
jgi:arylsulfatase A-like enzyme